MNKLSYHSPEYFFPKAISDLRGFAIFIMDKEGIITYWNKGCEVMKGYKAEEILGKNYEIFFPLFLREENLPAQELEVTSRIGKYETENWRVKKNGDLFWAYIVLTKVVDEDGEFIGYVKITQDHTDKKILEDELRKKNDDLGKTYDVMEKAKAKIDRDLDGFVYTASHDLKSPIANMEGILNAFASQDCYKDPTCRTLLDMFEKSVEKLKMTIGELTEISKTQKLIEEDVQDVDLRELIEEVKFSINDLIVKSNAEIEINVDSCPTIKFSIRNLRSIVYNLLSNAIKYHSPERIPKIIIRADLLDGKYVITVKDNGLGIKKENLDKVFLMFKRFHTHVEGTGIGLYMTKRIVDNVKGKITLESELGKGSTFTIFLKA